MNYSMLTAKEIVDKLESEKDELMDEVGYLEDTNESLRDIIDETESEKDELIGQVTKLEGTNKSLRDRIDYLSNRLVDNYIGL